MRPARRIFQTCRSKAIPVALGFNFTLGTINSIGALVTPTFTRATTKTITDWEGLPKLILSGEVPFEGQRRVFNYLTFTEDFSNAAWASLSGGTGSAITKTPNYGIAPDSTQTACRVQWNRGAGTSTNDFSAINNAAGPAPIKGNVYTASVWIKSNTGANIVTWFRAQQDVPDTLATITATPAWQRMSVTLVRISAGISPAQFSLGAFGTAGDQVGDILIWHPQDENVTGQSNWNPSEYVSVGALSSPYHGANVDGVKYFQTLNGNTVTNNVVAEATGTSIPLSGTGIGWCPGSAVNIFSTPDSSASRITGDIELIAYVALANWASGAVQGIIRKWYNASVSVTRNYELQIDAAGNLRIATTPDGVTSTSAASSVSTGFAAGTGAWIRASRVAATGVVTFYTSTASPGADPRTLPWTQLGTTVATTAGGIVNSDGVPEVGRSGLGGDLYMTGSVIRALAYNGVLGTTGPAWSFDSRDWTSGTTFVSSTTGETWTLNGGAKINKWPNIGYFPEVASTNLVLQASNFGATWVAVGTPTRSAAALRAGSYTLDLIGDDDGAVLEGYTQVITFTGDAVKAGSILFAQGTSTSTVIRQRDTTGAADRLLCAITWTNGVPVVTMTTGTALTGKTGQSGWEPLANGVFRLLVQGTSTTAANVNQIEIYPATTSALAVANTGNVYVGVVQFENATVPSSLIDTTTATVTRNKDQMQVGSLGAWFNAAAGTLVASVVAAPTVPTDPHIVACLDDGTTNNRMNLFQTVGNAASFDAVTGGVTQATVGTANLLTAGARNVMAGGYAVNDFTCDLNGGTVATDTLASVPTVTKLNIGQYFDATLQFGGGIRTLLYYNTRLPNTSLLVLTSS